MKLRKTLAVLVFLVLAWFPGLVFGSKAILPTEAALPTGTGAARYIHILGSEIYSTIEYGKRDYLAPAGTLSDFLLKASVKPSGAGNYWTIVLWRNGSATSVANGGAEVSFTIDENTPVDALGYAYVSSSAIITANRKDRFCWAVTAYGTVSASNLLGGCSFTGTTAKESPLFGTTSNSSLSATDAVENFISLAGHSQHFDFTNLFNTQMVFPCNGTVKGLLVELNTQPGGVTYRDFWFNLEGVDQAVTCRISGADKEGEDTINSVSVTAGQLGCIRTLNGGGAAASWANIGIIFESETDGQFILPMSSGSNDISAASTTYAPVAASSSFNSNGIGSNYQQAPIAFTAKAIYAKLNGVPYNNNAVDSYTFGLYVNGSITSLVKELADQTTAANYATDVSVAAGANIALRSVPNSSPTARKAMVSLLGYIAPAGTDTSKMLMFFR